MHKRSCLEIAQKETLQANHHKIIFAQALNRKLAQRTCRNTLYNRKPERETSHKIICGRETLYKRIAEERQQRIIFKTIGGAANTSFGPSFLLVCKWEPQETSPFQAYCGMWKIFEVAACLRFLAQPQICPTTPSKDAILEVPPFGCFSKKTLFEVGSKRKFATPASLPQGVQHAEVPLPSCMELGAKLDAFPRGLQELSLDLLASEKHFLRVTAWKLTQLSHLDALRGANMTSYSGRGQQSKG